VANTGGTTNTFIGQNAGVANVTNNANTFVGQNAGAANTADNNTFVGQNSGAANINGTNNTFNGMNAGPINTAGTANAFFGHSSGVSNTAGNNNSFFGERAGVANSLGTGNTFVGEFSGTSNTSESNNTCLGYTSSGSSGMTNTTAIGANALVTASNSLVLGCLNGINGGTADTSVGIRTTAPNSFLQVNGSFALPLRSISAAATLGATDYTVVSTAAAGVPTLPTAVGIAGRIYVLKNRSGGTITPATTAGQTIDGAVPPPIGNSALLIVQSDGSNWVRLN
jgi:hypothetical protein